jgi:dolichol-phosphate mannosyltransferase
VAGLITADGPAVIVAVVLPAFNEAGNLGPLVREVDAMLGEHAPGSRIVIVNDGSTDGTAGELRQLAAEMASIDVVTHDANRGMAAALKTGIARACETGCDAAVFLDSDLSHRPADMPGLLAALRSGADVVLGSRFVAGGGMTGVPLWRVLISRAGNAFGRVVLGVPFRDLTTGYRAVRREVLETVQLGEDGFTIQLESVIRAHAAGYRVAEVPIVLGTRRHGESHMSYSVQLFKDYWRLLMSCRGWLKERPRS